jgi:comEA protein
MSFYRSFIAAAAALGLATSVFAAEANKDAADVQAKDAAPAVQLADQSSADQSAQPSEDNQAKLNLNTATAKELMKVKGLNAAKAKAIVSYRKKHGDFKSTDDLKMVKGFKKMKDETIKQIQDQLTVG